MPLNVDDLKKALRQVFADGRSAPDSDTVANDLAQAIHDYIVTASVNGVVVNVVDGGGHPLGTGTQTTAVAVG
ncbi:MAG TPA: hypothetical protein VFY10_09380 [Dehalococcoidia bacterium]|nr:hypothetical protein [Dehalococcoidia bacterium]